MRESHKNHIFIPFLYQYLVHSVFSDKILVEGETNGGHFRHVNEKM